MYKGKSREHWMWMGSEPIRWAGRALRKVGTEILRRSGIEGTWIDVGAHRGEYTLWQARHNPGLRIYAIEPNLRAAAKLVGRAPNYMVIPMAIAETDGYADFYLNKFEASSSLLPLNDGAPIWSGGTTLEVGSVATVPTIRLDTLMDLLEIDNVDFLKIDAQGMDLAVVKSAGKKLKDIAKITMEVWVAPRPQYIGVPSRNEVIEYLGQQGFALVEVEEQTDGLEQNLTFARADQV